MAIDPSGSPIPEFGPKIKERHGYVSIPAYDFRDRGVWDILISDNSIRTMKGRGLGHALELGRIVPAVLRSPKAIFQGIRYPDDEDRLIDPWLCYVGVPNQAYDKSGSPRPPWPDEVYMVFVNADRIAYHWRWEKCCPDNPWLPMDHAKRFKERVL